MDTKKRLFSYIKNEKKYLVFAFISVVIYLICHLSIPFIVGKALDKLVDYAGDISSLNLFIVISLVLCVLGFVFNFIYDYSISKMTQIIVKKIREDIYDKINAVSVETINKDSLGNLLQLEIQDVENIANGFYSVLKQLVQGVLSIIITIVLMFMVNWILALGVIILSPLSVIVSRFVAKFSHKYFKKQAKLQSNLNSISLEGINNINLLQSLNYENESLNEFKEASSILKREGRIAQFSASWTNPTTRLVNNIIYACIGISGIIMILFSGSVNWLAMTIGKLSSFLSYTNEYTKPFNEISSVLSEFETAKYSFIRVNEFLNRDNDKNEGKIILEKPVEEIDFNDMSFSYTNDKKLIEHFNQKIIKGNKIAIVGTTGAGKTTLINLLMRFYDPCDGKILLNGIDYLNIPKKDIRENFGMVLQDTWIFKGTILDNVRYAKLDATDEEVINACKAAHAHSFIQTLPHGYDTIVSSKEGLSEGEKQLLTIARVMLKLPNIVILDEATSNVDTRTEKRITKAFDNLLKGRTSIVIAHRLSTIQEADVILVLSKGQVVEQGNHETLMKQKGEYYSLYTSQFK